VDLHHLLLAGFDRRTINLEFCGAPMARLPMEGGSTSRVVNEPSHQNTDI
jgi:hypothetical protein